MWGDSNVMLNKNKRALNPVAHYKITGNKLEMIVSKTTIKRDNKTIVRNFNEPL